MAKPTTTRKSTTANRGAATKTGAGSVTVGRSAAQQAPPPERQQTQVASPPEERERQTASPQETGRLVPPPATSQPPVAGNGAAATGTAMVKKIDLASDAMQYQDSFDRTALQLPFLIVIQPGSPQVKKGQPGYIEGVQMSQFFNTLSKESYDGMEQGLEVIPCYHYSTFIEWVLREEGGGFIADHGLEKGLALQKSCRKNAKNQDILPNGHQLVRTEVYFLLVVLEDEDSKVVVEEVMFPLSSTNLKHARNWNSRIMSRTVEIPGKGEVQAPMFFNTWVLKTFPDKNDKGEWYGVNVEDGQPTLNLGDDIYLAARRFRQIAQGNVQAGTVSHEAAGAPAGVGNTGEDIPF